MTLRSIATRVGAASVLACLSLVLISPVSGASGLPNLWVSTSGTNVGNNCQTESSPCQTIQWALTVAPEGATVNVAAGTYNEQVKIIRPVTILGSTGSAKTIIEPQAVPAEDSDTDSPYPQFYVIDATHTTGVDLKDLVIDGTAATATFDSDGDACAQDYVGAYYHDASGSMTNDTVTGINLPPDLFGCQGGQGVYVTTDSGQPDASVLSMTFDNVNNYDKNGITCDDPGTVCTITNTTVTGIGSTPLIGQNGIQIWSASAKLSLDTVTGNTYDGPDYAASGVLIGNPYTLSMKHNFVTDNDSNVYVIQDQDPAWVYCGNTGTDCTNPAKAGTTFTFTHNTVSDATNVDGNPLGSGYGDGLDLDSVTESTKALSNTADNDPGIGIALYGATGATVKKDTAKLDGDGIYLGSGTASSAATGNVVTRNKVASANIDGILADTSSSGNTITANTVHNDASWDAQDNSTGAGTANTADTWSGNHCSTSDPSGLC